MICMTKPHSPKTNMPGYRIPQKAYDIAINVPMEIADDDQRDPKVRLSAVKEVRTTIDHHYEIQCFLEDRQAAQEADTPGPVIVIDDETFFDNDAHAQAKIAQEENPNDYPYQPGDPPS